MTMTKEQSLSLEQTGAAAFAAILEMVDALNAAGEDYSAREPAEQTIHEDPLSVMVRSGWYAPGDPSADRKPAEYEILLSTGGPATRIIGELSEHGEPTTAILQAQDWFLPWTDWRGSTSKTDPANLEETLLTYARCFYFAE